MAGITKFTNVNVSNDFYIGGVEVTATAAELNILDTVTATAAELNILDTVTATAAELNYLDITTLGTGAASKAVVLDSGDDYTWPTAGVLTYGGSALSATGAQLTGAVAAPVLAAEHGAGAIGTGDQTAPRTRRWTENGVIVTQTTFDVTGLESINDADDVIGLAAGAPAAFIGQNVVATNGVIFRAELSCLETPATGATDIDVRFSAAADGALDTDGAGYGSLIDGGSLTAGQTLVNNVPAVTANHYYYLTAGTGGAGTYTAGMFVLTTYGHALLA